MFSLELHYFSIALYDVCLVFTCVCVDRWDASRFIEFSSDIDQRFLSGYFDELR